MRSVAVLLLKGVGVHRADRMGKQGAQSNCSKGRAVMNA